MADYGFVPYIPRQTYNRAGKPVFSGFFDITVTAQQPLRIGSGFGKLDANDMKAEIVRFGDVPVIPGSSMKGCIRAIAAAVSDSCMPRKAKDENYSTAQLEMSYEKCSKDNRCIVCDMFGLMGFASRIEFGDMKAAENTQIITYAVPVSAQPNANNSAYYTQTKDGRESNGRKFYHKQNSQPSEKGQVKEKYIVEAVQTGTVFSGSINFHSVTVDELALLAFSMGCDETFMPKLGGNRAHNFGSVSIKVKGTHSIGEKSGMTAAALAKYYFEKTASDECRKNIGILRKILSKESG